MERSVLAELTARRAANRETGYGVRLGLLDTSCTEHPGGALTVSSSARGSGHRRLAWALGIAVVVIVGIVVTVLELTGGRGQSHVARSSTRLPAMSKSDAAALSQTLSTGNGAGLSEELRALLHGPLHPGAGGSVTVDPKSIRVAPGGGVANASAVLPDGKHLSLVLTREQGHWRLLSASVAR